MTNYVVFLRGINVGGHKKVPMAELKKMFAEMGFENIKTLLNSGNAIFESEKEKESSLVKKIGKQLEKSFGFKVNVIVRTGREIQKLIYLDPLKKYPERQEYSSLHLFLAQRIKKPIRTSLFFCRK